MFFGDNLNKREAKELGDIGVRTVASALGHEGFKYFLTDYMHPFDILVYRNDDSIVAGLEVKWLGNRNRGTRIDKNAKRRKMEFASNNNLNGTYTVIVRPDGKLGWREGIRNLPAVSFDFNMGGLYADLRRHGA